MIIWCVMKAPRDKHTYSYLSFPLELLQLTDTRCREKCSTLFKHLRYFLRYRGPGPTLYVRRHTSDVYRRQILMSTVDPRTVRVNLSNGNETQLTLYSPNNWIVIFTHLNLCIAGAIQNFKWLEIIQIWQNGGQRFLKSRWLMSRYL